MTYREWFDAHADKHKALMQKLLSRGMDKEAILDYFDFDNMVKMEPDFCPLYAEGKKCHDMEKLNCYLCACPHFRFNDKGLRTEEGAAVYSACAIHAKEGVPVRFGDAIHLDCSACTLPHRRSVIDKLFDTEWERIMSRCRTP